MDRFLAELEGVQNPSHSLPVREVAGAWCSVPLHPQRGKGEKKEKKKREKKKGDTGQRRCGSLQPLAMNPVCPGSWASSIPCTPLKVHTVCTLLYRSMPNPHGGLVACKLSKLLPSAIQFSRNPNAARTSLSWEVRGKARWCRGHVVTGQNRESVGAAPSISLPLLCL